VSYVILTDKHKVAVLDGNGVLYEHYKQTKGIELVPGKNGEWVILGGSCSQEELDEIVERLFRPTQKT